MINFLAINANLNIILVYHKQTVYCVQLTNILINKIIYAYLVILHVQNAAIRFNILLEYLNKIKIIINK